MPNNWPKVELRELNCRPCRAFSHPSSLAGRNYAHTSD